MRRAPCLSFAAALLLHAPTLEAQSAPLPPPPAALLRLARDARDADLRGDWTALTAAHDAIHALRAVGRDTTWADYYLGYADWRRASLAWMGEGPGGTAALQRQAAAHLAHALEAEPGMVEARVLLALAEAPLAGDPQRAAEVVPRLRANVARAVAEAPDNPRVRTMRAMLTVLSPAATRAGRDSAVAAWRAAAESFPATSPAGEPEWGRAESWAWLGGALLYVGDHAGTRAALERAVQDRPDFWWARDVALPQAVRSRLGASPP